MLPGSGRCSSPPARRPHGRDARDPARHRLLSYSFLTRGAYGGVELPWSQLKLPQAARSTLLGAIFLRSFVVATVADGVLPAARISAGAFHPAPAAQNLYLSLVILPFWTSFLIRTYAWMFLLRDTGLMNTALQSFELIHDPLPLLYNEGAVILGLVYGYLPFVVLPVYATLDGWINNLAGSLGGFGRAALGRILTRVIIPLSTPAFAPAQF